MPHSHAYNEFTVSLAKARALLLIEQSYPDPAAPHDQDTIGGLRGGALVLIVASFEAFLKGLSMEHIDSLGKAFVGPLYSQLPEAIRIHNVFETLNMSVKSPPFLKPPTQKKDRLPAIRQACAAIMNEKLNATAFSKTNSNPNSNTVLEVFERLGLPRVLNGVKREFESSTHWDAPVSVTFIPDKLNEIIGRRNEVAHTAGVMNLSRAQLSEYVRFIAVLAEVLDGAMQKHTKDIRVKAGVP